MYKECREGNCQFFALPFIRDSLLPPQGELILTIILTKATTILCFLIYHLLQNDYLGPIAGTKPVIKFLRISEAI